MSSKIFHFKIILTFLTFLGLSLHGFSQIQVGQDIDGESLQDESGWSVSMPDPYTLAIGAPDNDGNGSPGISSYGHVRVYHWSGSMWIQKGQDIDGEATGDGSGYSVSMPDANTVAIGARGNDGGGNNAGHVRIYIWNGLQWVQKGSDIDGVAAWDRCGHSVHMPDPNTVVTGSVDNDANGNNAGHVRIFTWNGLAWIQKGLAIEGEAADDKSGWSVSMPNPDIVAIGATDNDDSALNAGHVRIYEWNGSSWVQKGNDIDGEADDNKSGTAVCMPDANTVAIGAPRNDASGPGLYYGHVRVYEWNGSSWVQKGIDIDGELPYDNSGYSVSMPDANTVAIGATSDATTTGQVKIYKWIGNSWVQVGQDIDGEALGDNFGMSVSMPDTSTLAVGARYNSDNGTHAGHVRVYKLRGVQGVVYNDVNENCIQEELPVVEGIIGVIQPGNITVETGENGAWFLDSLPAGSYTITYDTTLNWIPTCPNPVNFTITNPDAVTTVPSFGMVNTNPCPSPNISVFMPTIRLGFSNQKIFVKACNDITATGAVNNGSVVLSLDDSLTLDAASIPYTSLGNNSFSFDVGTLNPGECVDFTLSATLSNTDILGRTVCMEAQLFPIDSCALDSIVASSPPDFTPCNLPWDKSSLQIEGECLNDSIFFTISNTGAPGEGDMDCYSPLRLYIDGIYMWLDSIQLNGGDSVVFSFAGDGKTWHMEVDQHPLHPGNSNPNATVELCGNPSNWTPDLVNIFPHDDYDPINDIYCGIITGSYDPNDKKGLPTGVGPDHLVTPNGKIDYAIRFQNTGTDTAFTVVIRDTLDVDLDIYSVQSGVSSHPYVFQMYGPRVLQWTFNNILLPDSTTNEPQSHGFVTFTANHEPDLPNGTVINNTADIYFDYNSPIITNTTSHIIYDSVGVAPWTEEYAISNTACDSIDYNGDSYNQSGTFYQVIEGLATDTLVTLNLTINESNVVTDTDTICDSYTWIDGVTYTSSNNTATHTLTNSAGCDSVVNLDLTINNSTTATDVLSACNSYTWIDGVTYTSNNNTATHILTNSVGCDSVITLSLTINNSSAETDEVTACDSYTWIDGVTYTTSNNTATHTLTNVAGCDSIVTLDLTINNSSSSTDVQFDCDSIVWIDGVTYTSSNNTATHILTNSVGCDSVVSLDLSINSTDEIDVQVACDTFTWIDGATYTSSNNTATYVYTNSFGCDSTIHLDLTINTISDLTTLLSGITITANNSNADYVWLDCDSNYMAISGETSQTFTPTQNGNYAVQLTESGCIDTSACVSITNIGIIENSLAENFVLFPNPTQGELTITFENEQQVLNVSIYSVTGELLEQNTYENTAEVKLDLKGADGTYLLKLKNNDQEATISVIKE